MNNGIANMTQFELDIMEQYLTKSGLLLSLRKDEIQKIYESCARAIQAKIMEDPSIEEKVELNCISMVAKVVDEIRQEYSVSEDLINDAMKILNQNYGMIFSKLKMVQPTNGYISSYDFYLNHRNCKVASEELAAILQQKEQLRRFQ